MTPMRIFTALILTITACCGSDDSYAIFYLCDGDGNGLVSEVELRKCAIAVGADHSVFSTLDSNGDNSLTKGEMSSAHYTGTPDCGHEMMVKTRASLMMYIGTREPTLETYCNSLAEPLTGKIEEYEQTCSHPLVSEYSTIMKEIVENEQAGGLCNNIDLSELQDADDQGPGESDSCTTEEIRECLVELVILTQDPAEGYCEDIGATLDCMEAADTACETEASALMVRAVELIYNAFVNNDLCTSLVSFA